MAVGSFAVELTPEDQCFKRPTSFLASPSLASQYFNHIDSLFCLTWSAQPCESPGFQLTKDKVTAGVWWAKSTWTCSKRRVVSSLCAYSEPSHFQKRTKQPKAACGFLFGDWQVNGAQEKSQMLSVELRHIIQVIWTLLNTNRKELVCNILFSYGISSCIIH